MWYVGVWERDEGLARAARELCPRARVRSGSHPAQLGTEPMELLAVSPAAVGWAGAAALSCRTVLLPHAAGPLARTLLARRVVSYGLSPRDTLTVSSLEEDRASVAVQRELIRPDGGLVERQELVVERRPGQTAELLLAETGLRLLLGEEFAVGP